MEMNLSIYRNKEKVNEIKSNDEKEIYKTIAQVLFCKDSKRATKTTIDYLNNNLKIIQVFDQYKTQIENVQYKYEYYFYGVEL